jgi:4'-phosphopantetheinyl transferase
VCSSDLDIGFDVEEARRPAPLDLAPRYFSRREIAQLGRLPPARRADRFYALWTFKEAYIKGRGLGLAIPLDSFTVEIAGASRGQARLVTEDREDRGGAWTLRGWKLEHHAMALAVRAASARVRVSLSPEQRIAALIGGIGLTDSR